MVQVMPVDVPSFEISAAVNVVGSIFSENVIEKLIGVELLVMV